ncbi:tetratricopeptide repeat protein, partial [bacterium]|nr:tetratricopeptide repeat protein [bacterium]
MGLPIHRLDGSPKASVFAYKNELDQWLDEKLHEHEIPRKGVLSLIIHKHRSLFIASLTLIAVVIIAVIIWRFLPRGGSAQISPYKPSLAVVYFKNNTGDESLSYWREALSDLLISDLTQSKYINVLSSDSLLNILKELNLLDAQNYSTDDLFKIATKARVDNILLGNYARSGDEFRIYAFIKQLSSGKETSLDRVDGRYEESFFPMVDELTKKVKAELKLSKKEIEKDIDMSIAQTTTSSPEALQLYLEGLKYLNGGYNTKSLPFFEKAVAIDAEFAMAYRGIAIVKQRGRFHTQATRYLQKALEFNERLSDRELYLIQADFYYLSERNIEKAIESYNKLLELYPDDPAGNNNLGSLYDAVEEFEKSAEYFEKNIKNEYKRVTSYQGLSGAYRALGMYDKAEEVLQSYLSNIGDNPAIHRSLGYVYAIQEKFNLAMEEAEKYFILVPDSIIVHRARGEIYIFMGDLDKAEKEYLLLLDPEDEGMQLLGRERLAHLFLMTGRLKEAREQFKLGLELGEKTEDLLWMSRFHVYLGYYHLKTGDFESAFKEWEKAIEKARKNYDFYTERHALHFKGLTHIAVGFEADAQNTAEILKEIIEKGTKKKDIRFYYHILGEIELNKENYSKAIKYFKEAISLLPFQQNPYYDRQALFYQSLASAYFKSGNLEKACDIYKKISHLTTGRLFFGDIYAKSFYMLGRIYEQQDNNAKAIEHYERFLDLRKDADPGIP